MPDTAVAGRWRYTPRSVGGVLRNEVGKGLATQLAHPLGHAVTLLVGATMYLGLQFVLGQGELRHDLLPATLLAVAGYWFLQYSGLVMVADLVEEKRAGTFAQALMSPAPPWLLVLGRLLTASLFGLAVAAVASLVPVLVAGITLPWHWAALVPLALLVLDALAFTFVLAAVALRSPMVGALQSLLTSLVLLLNGSFLPLALYPQWLAVVARFLPTTLGVQATAAVLVDGRSLAGTWTDGTLPLLVAHAVALAAAGGALFTRNHRRAVRDGRLGQY